MNWRNKPGKFIKKRFWKIFIDLLFQKSFKIYGVHYPKTCEKADYSQYICTHKHTQTHGCACECAHTWGLAQVHTLCGCVCFSVYIGVYIGGNTRSIFKRSLIGLHLEFPFSSVGCDTKVKISSLNSNISKGICTVWDTNKYIQGLKACITASISYMIKIT